MSVLYLGLASAAILLYSRIGWVIAQRLRKPTCRVCLHRGYCPTRKLCSTDENAKHCYDLAESEEPMRDPAATPNPDSAPL